jgi:hypothetical protein
MQMKSREGWHSLDSSMHCTCVQQHARVGCHWTTCTQRDAASLHPSAGQQESSRDYRVPQKRVSQRSCVEQQQQQVQVQDVVMGLSL